MNNIDIANGLIFQKLNLSKETFNDRLICQKKIYLLQSVGVDLGYEYNWYVRGPYSPSLTTYIYNNLDMLKNYDFSKYALNHDAEKFIEKVNNLSQKKSLDISDASWYELLASLLFIHNNKMGWKITSDNPEDLYTMLIQYKPQYNREQCKAAFDILNEEAFIV